MAMSIFFADKFFKESAPQLELLHSSFACVDNRWQGEVIRSQYSRLYFIKSGSFFVIDDEGYRTDFYEGGVYLIPSGYSYVYGCEEKNELFSFHIRLFGFDNIDLLGRFKRPVFCSMEVDLDRLSGVIDQRGVTPSLVLKSEIYRALSEIALQSGGLLDTAIYSSDVNSAIEFVSSHLSARLTVTEIADAVNLAKSTLSGKFRREVGMSVGEYIDYRVILAAAQMLFSGDRSVLEISEELGFCDQFYFSRRFKERYGVSPQKFRKM